MIEYSENMDVAKINGITFRKDKNTGYYLSGKAINGKRKRLHVYVWELHNGKVKEGFQIHHIDHNKYNNEIENLAELSKEEHSKLHAEELTDEQRAKKAENVVKNAIPKAKEWHGSEEGRKWHSEHAKDAFSHRDVLKYQCTFCGKEFETKNIYGESQNRFCSANCKAAFRRKSGVDKASRKCLCCGGEFRVYKYSKTKNCEKCRNKKHSA